MANYSGEILEIVPQGTSVSVSGTWRNVVSVYVMVSGVWRIVSALYVSVSNSWKTVE